MSIQSIPNSKILQINGSLVKQLGKAENASQSPAFFYSLGSSDPLALDKFQQLAGLDAGLVNMTDYDGALRSLSFMKWGMQANFVFGDPYYTAVAVKHSDPSNAAMAKTPELVLQSMIDCDLDSIMGGTVACDFEITAERAEILRRYKIPKGHLPRILHAVLAPRFDEEAVRILDRKDARCRVLQNPSLRLCTVDVDRMFHSVRGGFLIQQNYNTLLNLEHPQVQIIGSFEKEQKMDLVLAWAICASSRSNTTTAVKHLALQANACGQQSRVRSARLLKVIADETGQCLTHSAICTDSFMPKRDGADVLIGYKPAVVFASRGSKGDEEVMNAFRESKTAFVTLPDEVIRGFCKHR